MDTVTDDFNEWQEEYRRQFFEMVDEKLKSLPEDAFDFLEGSDEPVKCGVCLMLCTNCKRVRGAYPEKSKWFCVECGAVVKESF